MSLKNVD